VDPALASITPIPISEIRGPLLTQNDSESNFYTVHEPLEEDGSPTPISSELTKCVHRSMLAVDTSDVVTQPALYRVTEYRHALGCSFECHGSCNSSDTELEGPMYEVIVLVVLVILVLQLEQMWDSDVAW